MFTGRTYIAHQSLFYSYFILLKYFVRTNYLFIEIIYGVDKMNLVLNSSYNRLCFMSLQVFYDMIYVFTMKCNKTNLRNLIWK